MKPQKRALQQKKKVTTGRIIYQTNYENIENNGVIESGGNNIGDDQRVKTQDTGRDA
jgi:hypothetical protein